jgi:hypothetical protein
MWCRGAAFRGLAKEASLSNAGLHDKFLPVEVSVNAAPNLPDRMVVEMSERNARLKEFVGRDMLFGAISGLSSKAVLPYQAEFLHLIRDIFAKQLASEPGPREVIVICVVSAAPRFATLAKTVAPHSPPWVARALVSHFEALKNVHDYSLSIISFNRSFFRCLAWMRRSWVS